MQIYPYLSPCTVKSKWVKDLNIKPDTLNLLQEIVEKSFERNGTGDNFRNPFVRSGFHWAYTQKYEKQFLAALKWQFCQDHPVIFFLQLNANVLNLNKIPCIPPSNKAHSKGQWKSKAALASPDPAHLMREATLVCSGGKCGTYKYFFTLDLVLNKKKKKNETTLQQ